MRKKKFNFMDMPPNPSMAEIIEYNTQWASLSDKEQISIRNKQLDKMYGTLSITDEVQSVKQPKIKTAYYTDDEWENARKAVFARDGKMCYICNNPATQVDHLLPKSKYPELALELENLKPVCWPCNKKKNTTVYEEYITKFNVDRR